MLRIERYKKSIKTVLESLPIATILYCNNSFIFVTKPAKLDRKQIHANAHIHWNCPRVIEKTQNKTIFNKKICIK